VSARRREGGRQAGEVLSTLGRACARDVVGDDAGSAVCEGQERCTGRSRGWGTLAPAEARRGLTFQGLVRNGPVESRSRPRSHRSSTMRRTSQLLRTAAHPDVVVQDEPQVDHLDPLKIEGFFQLRLLR
jgi:hypothetical protein